MSRVAVLKGTAKIAQHGPGLIREICYGAVLGIGGKSLNIHSTLVSISFASALPSENFTLDYAESQCLNLHEFIPERIVFMFGFFFRGSLQ